MTAKALYTMFSELFPNLAEGCKSCKLLSHNVILIKRKDKGSYTFVYRNSENWVMEYRRNG